MEPAGRDRKKGQGGWGEGRLGANFQFAPPNREEKSSPACRIPSELWNTEKTEKTEKTENTGKPEHRVPPKPFSLRHQSLEEDKAACSQTTAGVTADVCA